MLEKIKVLLLATNQLDLAYIRLGDEIREIDERIRRSAFRDLFELISKFSIRVNDLTPFLLQHTPQILHFSGHGRPSDGLILEDDKGNIAPVGVAELMGIVRPLKDNLRLVFFNACYSAEHAKATVEEVDYAIGMKDTFDDEAAIAFAASFYEALAYGRSVHKAFELATAELTVQKLPGVDIPELFVREGVNASEPFIKPPKELAKLKSLVKRFIDGIASTNELLAIDQALEDGSIILDDSSVDSRDKNDEEPSFTIRLHNHQFYGNLNTSVYQRLKARLSPTPSGIVPPLPPFIFIGRDGALQDVKQLLGTSKDSSREKKTTVVRGWPGVGKTSLVGVIGHDQDIVSLFPQGVLWTSLEQKPDLLSVMAQWGRALGSDEIFRAPTLKEAIAKLAALLRQRQMLLIVDDVWDTANATPFIEAVGEQCALLVTTRITSVAEDLTPGGENIYILPVLTEEDSLKLLRTRIPAIVAQYEDECRELVRDLECLPLALHVAGSLLRSEANLGWGVRELIQEIRDGAKLISASAPLDRAEEGKIPTVQALLMKSTNMLDEFTRDCFAYLGAFAPKPATFDLNAMQAVWEVDDAKPIVRELVGHGLLEPAPAGRFQMHRILVDLARELCS